MAADLVAGVDCSTQATKVVLIDPSDGTVLGSGRSAHSVSGTGGRRQSDPEGWWRALRDALAQTGLAPRVGAISVAAQQHGLVVLDAAGRPLHDALLWNDTRSARQAEQLLAIFGGAAGWAQTVGVVPVAALTVSKWAWFRRYLPELARQAATVLLPHDYLTLRLSGAAVTDRGDASGTGWWSGRTGQYVPEVLEDDRVRLPSECLPRVLGASDVAGTVTGAAGAELGLPAGSLVAPGTGDNMAAALGLGIGPGAPVLSLGTSGTVFMVAERWAADRTGTVATFADAAGAFLPLACTLNCTLAVDKFAELLGLDREAATPGGSVVVLPFLDGERTPDLPDASGLVVGLRQSTTAGDILGAAYEGAAASLLLALDSVAASAGGPAADEPLIVVGGGARGGVWRSTLARLSGRELLVPRQTELAAVGAAVQAAGVWRREQFGAVARRWNTLSGERIGPALRDHATWERIAAVRAAALGRQPEVSDSGGARWLFAR